MSQVAEIMAQNNLTAGRDQRCSPMLKANGELDTSMLYRALKNEQSAPDAWAQFVWQNKAPPRVKFFAWLLSLERIQCKTTLRRKNIVDNTTCEACLAPDETAAHILFGCPSAQQFWNALQIPTQLNWPVQAIKEISPPDHRPRKHFNTFLLLCCWHIWKRRNARVFRSDRTTLSATLGACKTEAYLWGSRLPRQDRMIATTWCSILANTM
jgi:hypothetical protein